QNSAERAFQLQQLSLYVETSAITAQRSVGGDHAMARDHDRYWIAIVRHAHCAKPLWLANGACNVGIGPSLAIRNRQQSPPTGQLKIRAPEIEREHKTPPPSREVLVEFGDVALRCLGR